MLHLIRVSFPVLENKKVILLLYDKSVIDQAFSVKIAQY